MKDPFLEDCGGWTPAPDVLTRNYGFETAYTWGRIRRLCQLGGGTFTASHEAIGKRIGMSRRALMEILKVLVRDGYVEDLTPGVRNKAHTYSIRRGEDKILAGRQISHTKDDIPTETPNPDALESDVGMRNLPSDYAEIAHQEDVGRQELPTSYAENAHPGRQNLHLKRDSLETDSRDLKDSSPNGEGEKAPPPKKRKAKEPAEIPEGVKIYRSLAHLYPDKALWSEIDQTVGTEQVSLTLWHDVIYGYIGSGYHKRNVKTMLEYYRRREIPTTQKNGVSNGTHQNTNRKGIKALEETGESLRDKRTFDIYTNEYVYPDGHREPAAPVS